MDSLPATFPLLDSTNWSDWKKAIRGGTLSFGGWEIISGKETHPDLSTDAKGYRQWGIRAQKAAGYLLSSIKPKAETFLDGSGVDVDDPASMFTKLESKFCNQTAVGRFNALEVLLSTHQTTDSLTAYLASISQGYNKLCEVTPTSGTAPLTITKFLEEVYCWAAIRGLDPVNRALASDLVTSDKLTKDVVNQHFLSLQQGLPLLSVNGVQSANIANVARSPAPSASRSFSTFSSSTVESAGCVLCTVTGYTRRAPSHTTEKCDKLRRLAKDPNYTLDGHRNRDRTPGGGGGGARQAVVEHAEIAASASLSAPGASADDKWIPHSGAKSIMTLERRRAAIPGITGFGRSQASGVIPQKQVAHEASLEGSIQAISLLYT